LVQITVAPGRSIAGVVATVAATSCSEMLPKIPQSNGRSTGRADAKVAVSPASPVMTVAPSTPS
jgi:hypothetical protein